MPSEDVLHTMALFRRSGWGSWTEFMTLTSESREAAAEIGDLVEERNTRSLAAAIGVAVHGGAVGTASATGEDEIIRAAAEEDVARKTMAPQRNGSAVNVLRAFGA